MHTHVHVQQHNNDTRLTTVLAILRGPQIINYAIGGMYVRIRIIVNSQTLYFIQTEWEVKSRIYMYDK